MSKKYFSWITDKYGRDEIIREDLGWAITNKGMLEAMAPNGEWYEFSPDMLEVVYYFKPGIGFPGAISIQVKEEYKEAMEESFGKDTIVIASWKSLENNDALLKDVFSFTCIMDDNIISSYGDYKKFVNKFLKRYLQILHG